MAIKDFFLKKSVLITFFTLLFLIVIEFTFDPIEIILEIGRAHV